MRTRFIGTLFLFVLMLPGMKGMGQCALSEIYKNSELIRRNAYNGNGQLLKTEIFNNSPKGFKRYSYGPDGKLTLVERISSKGNLKKEQKYSYNAKGLLESIKTFEKGQLVEETIFTYKKKELAERLTKSKKKTGAFSVLLTRFTIENENVVASETYKKDGQELDLRKKTVYTYDTSPNPYRGGGDGVKDLSKNNILTKTEYDRFERADKKNSYTASIKYNDKGFPVEMIRKFQSGKHTVREFRYNCK